MTRNLLVFLPLGEPHVSKKMDILRTNLATINKGCPDPWSRVVVKVAVYTKNLQWPADIKGVEVLRRPGVVGDFFRELVTPKSLEEEGHDFLLMLLDDVEIVSQPDWKRLLVIKEFTGASLLSPTLSHDSANIVYPYMKHVSNAKYTARMLTQMEYFMFLFDTKSYSERYYTLLDPANPWMWGIDLCLHFSGQVMPLQVNDWIVKHYYQGESYKLSSRNPQSDMVIYLAKKGYTVENLWSLRFVISVLHMQHLTSEQWDGLWQRIQSF